MHSWPTFDCSSVNWSIVNRLTSSSVATRSAKASAAARPRAWRRQVEPGGRPVPAPIGQHQPGGAVPQADHVRHAHPLEHPRADDAASSAGAVDDDRLRLLRLGSQDVGDPKRELTAGHAPAAWDAVLAVLLRRARVENDQALSRPLSAMQLGRVDCRDVVLHLDPFAEVLAGDVHAPLGQVALAGPGVDAALQHADPPVVQALGGAGG